MKRLAWTLVLVAACGGGTSSSTASSSSGSITGGGGATGSGGATSTTTAGTGGATTTTTTTATSGSGGAGGQGGAATSTSTSTSATTTTTTTTTTVSSSSSSSTAGAGGSTSMPCGGSCPSGYTCGTANGIEVCRAASGIPLFSHVTVILMENTSLSTLQTAMNGNGAPNLALMASKYATGSDYHGVAHPSLPNYIALTSGGTQGIACDCKAQMGQGTCNLFSCNLVLGTCSCDQPATVTSIADQLEAAQMSWMAFGEGMGTACNLTDNAGSSYAVRHVPFLYYDGIQTNAARCHAHVVDFAGYSPSAPAKFNFIAPNLVHDMHDPILAGPQNILNGDGWIGPQVAAITASTAYTQGGLLVVVWDEDDGSGGLGGTDDPIGVFVMSPYAKHSGFVSHVKANHYSLLATFEDGLGLARLGSAGMAHPGIADTLSDYFPAN